MRISVALALSVLHVVSWATLAYGQRAVACRDPQKPMLEAELLFGRNIGGRLGVTDARWARFLAREVTPRFPDGLTVIDGSGQWRGGERIAHERSKIVIIVTRDEPQSHERIAAIAAAYRQRFHQRSVGILMRSVCASF